MSNNDNPIDQRAQVIAGLRALADLAERIPELPIPHYITEPLDVDDDAVANDTLDKIEAALTKAGVEFSTNNRPDHGRRVIVQIDGISYQPFYVWDQVRTDYRARTSYERNVQVDETAAAVTA